MSSHQHRSQSGTSDTTTTTLDPVAQAVDPGSNQFMQDQMGQPEEAPRGTAGDIAMWLRMATHLAESGSIGVPFVSSKLRQAKEELMSAWGDPDVINQRDALKDDIVAADSAVIDSLARRAEAMVGDDSVDLTTAIAFPQDVRLLLHDLGPANPEGSHPNPWSFSDAVQSAGITRIAGIQSDMVVALQARFEPDEILAELQRNAAEGAEELWEQGDRDAGEFREAAGTSGNFDWCGMFTVSQYSFTGLDGQLRSGFWETRNVQDFFDVGRSGAPRNSARVPLWIEVTGDSAVDTAAAETDQDGRQWMHLADYHAARGSERSWVDASQLNGSNVRTGDAVLAGPTADNPTHIAMVHTVFGEAVEIVTVEGNASGIAYVGEGAAGGPQAVADATTNDASELAPSGEQAVHMNDFLADGDGLTSSTGHRYELSGRGRPSLVDFEAHNYAIAQPNPNASADENTGSTDV